MAKCLLPLLWRGGHKSKQRPRGKLQDLKKTVVCIFCNREEAGCSICERLKEHQAAVGGLHVANSALAASSVNREVDRTG